MLDAELAADAEAEDFAAAAADNDEPVAEVAGTAADADEADATVEDTAEVEFALFLLLAPYTNVWFGVTFVNDSDLFAKPTCCVSIL